MAGEIYIADKPTLDDIHRMVSTIYDVDNLTIYTNRKATFPNVETTLLDINGAGYLVSFAAYHDYTVSSTGNFYFKVEIDGVIKYSINGEALKTKGYLWGVKDWYDYITKPANVALIHNEIYPNGGLKFNNSLKITGYVSYSESFGWNNYAYAYKLLES